jgi:serine/threonine protein kinase
MQESEQSSPSERSSASGPRSSVSPATGSGSTRDQNDAPTVHTGSSHRRARLAAGGTALIPYPEPGQQIDSFTLDEAIGVGGMGAVFRAHDIRLERLVALKLLPPEQANDPEVVQRFYQEGRAAAQLDHENIARVYSIGFDGRYHYIVFEYIEGTTIRQRVERNGPLPLSEAINYTLQIAGALVHAAERGVVHRDIKPSNIIVTPQGRAKLVDMGLARRFERGGDDGLTQSGMTLGTFDYISPEQARDPRSVDVRSDLYSLGCTLFHMLSGRPPFPEGTVLQKLLQHQEEPPPNIRTLNPSVTPDLASILAKLMAKDPDRRYQTPEQLVRDLLTVAGALGLRSVSPEGLIWMAASTPSPWERQLVWALPLLAFLVIVVGLVWWGQEMSGPPPRTSPDLLPNLPTVQAPRPKPSPPAPTDDQRAAASATPTASAATPPPEADMAAAPRDITVDATEDLLAVLAEAPPRSIVVLADDGPYFLGGGGTDRPLGPLIGRELTIKADAGVRPVLRLSREAFGALRSPTALLDFQGGHLTLEGLDLTLEPGDRDDPLTAIRAEDTELTVRRCVFRHLGVRSRPGRDVALNVRTSARAGAGSDRPPGVLADACHFDGGQVGVLASGPVDLQLRDCTLGGSEPAFWFENGKAAGPVQSQLRLVHDSLLAGQGPVFRFDGTVPRVWVENTVVAPPRETEAVLVATDSQETLEWRGQSNLYSRIGVFLQSTESPPSFPPIRDFGAWTETPTGARETGTLVARTRIWEETDPAHTLAQEGLNPTRAFRLTATSPGAADLGAREGPFGSIALPVKIAANPTEPRPEQPTTAPPTPAPATVEHPTPPAAEPAPASTGAGASALRTTEMPEMPITPPAGRDNPLSRESTPTDPAPTASPTTAVPPASAPEPEPNVIRTAEKLLATLSEPGARGGTIRVAADAHWDLPRIAIRNEARWTIRAEPGPTRPRIRFRPTPADSDASASWSSWIELHKGTLQLEGIDLLLAREDAPRAGRWAAFSVWGGTDLSLFNCTVTIEGDDVGAAVVAVSGIEGDRVDDGRAAPETASVEIRLTDGLFRSGGDLVEVSGGRRLVLELNNAVVSTRGSLLHARGLVRGQAGEPLQLTLRQVTARTAGGLVQLESSPGEPELPRADITARDSILDTTALDTPLFRIDGQDNLAALRDRIQWEGHGVAYHEINAYRRDQTAQVGAVPKIYDRGSWNVAVGTKEAAPVHGDLKFADEWDPSRPAWTLRREDVRLAPDSPAASAGADLTRIPNPPPTTP